MKFTNTWTGNWKDAFRGLRHPMESYAKSDSIFGISECYGDETLDLEDIWLQKKNPELYNQYHSDNWLENTENKYIYACEEIEKWLWKNGVIQNDNKTNCFEYAFLGPNDLDLAQRMIKAGNPNDKFLRQIFVSVDITAPLYWWKEMDTYKVGTTANSTSTMHKLANTPITLDCFETDDLDLSIPIGAWSMATNKDYTPEPDYTATNVVSSSYKIVNPDNQEVIEEHTNYYSLKELNELKKCSLEQDIYGIINMLERLRKKYLETKDIRYWKELIRWLPESWLQTRTWTADYAVLRNIIHWRTGHKLTEWEQFIDWTKTLPYSEELLFYSQFDN